MFKKFLILPIILLFSLTAFASADTVDGFTSNTAICKNSFTELSLNEYTYFDFYNCELGDVEENSIYICVSTNDTPYYSSIPDVSSDSIINDNIVCYNSPISSIYGNNIIRNCGGVDGFCPNGYVYFSKSPITYSSSSDDSQGGLLPGSSDGSFGGGITNGVNSMLSGFGNVIPDLLLYGLPLLIVFLFWKWIRSYIKHFFVGGKLPEGDHITNCDLYAKNNGDFVHKYRDWRGKFVELHSLSGDSSNLDYINSKFRGRHFKEYADLVKETGDVDYAQSKLRGKYYKEYTSLYKTYFK